MKKHIWLFLFAFLPAVIIVTIIFFGWELQRKPGDGKPGEIAFTIERGETLKQISRSLADEGVISSPWFFEVLVRLSHKQNKLQAGDYELPRGLSLLQLIEALGNAQANQVQITFLEGDSIRSLADQLAKAGIVASSTFIDAAGRPTVDYGKLPLSEPRPADYANDFSYLEDKPGHYGYEGYLFPDTYRFSKTATSGQIIRKMLKNFDSKLSAAMRQEIARQRKTVWEVVIMASLLEKEVRTATDMKLVSDLFWRRLDRGQALQSDATLSYVLNDTVAAHSAEDLESDSPFNSYRFKGLPPTPIGNPGLAALVAAIYPEPNDYNFFLNDPKTGATIFAETFEQHKQNKRQYLY
ncbi:endolytic transglycosylase MltG [Candidatus Falkowbacteria bacterium]|nr:endolytic transglycosylase MltG [Candidatus Falkowbacteria bacterium]